MKTDPLKPMTKDFSTETVEGYSMTRRAFEAACEVARVKAVDGGEKKVVRFVISTEAQDLYGDVVTTRGWDLKGYKKNPVFLWGHDASSPPIGTAIEIAKNIVKKRLEATVLYAEDEYEFARTIANLARSGFVRATSVGFVPTKPPTFIDDEKDFEKHGMVKAGMLFNAQRLLETSNVNIPANPEALRLAYEMGGIDVARLAFGYEDEELEKALAKLGLVSTRVFVPGTPEPLDEGEEEQTAMPTKDLTDFVSRITARLSEREADGTVVIDETMADAWSEQAKSIAPEPEADVETDPIQRISDAVFERVLKKIEESPEIIVMAGAVLNRRNRLQLNDVEKGLTRHAGEIRELLKDASALDEEDEKDSPSPVEKDGAPYLKEKGDEEDDEEDLDEIKKRIAKIQETGNAVEAYYK